MAKKHRRFCSLHLPAPKKRRALTWYENMQRIKTGELPKGFHSGRPKKIKSPQDGIWEYIPILEQLNNQ